MRKWWDKGEAKITVVDDENKVLTIGHSTLSLGRFFEMLSRAGVTAVADVRSSPFSRRFPHFSRDDFRRSLKEIGVKYVFLGKELGGRPRAQNLYLDGVADYEKMAREPGFLKGLDRVVDGSKEHKIALMCSEHNPMDCHRCLLVGRSLAARKVPLGHILNNGSIVTQHAVEEKLLALVGAEEKNMKDMFASRDELLAVAYRSRAKTVAYRESEQKLTEPGAPYWSHHAS